MKANISEHLPKNKRIQLGSYYTPEKLVNRVYDLINPYLQAKAEDVVVFDSAGGYGAFLINNTSHNFRIADYDAHACKILKKRFGNINVFHTNSLVGVNREKFLIPSSSFLIMVGNPPYNDTTSEFKKGEKGENLCDPDLFDRDLGVSFLKSYYKLKADLVCILHPLSYLIKEINFNRLREFKDNYRLIKGEIFSSELFRGTGLSKFPILVALYEKNDNGMTFDYILNFRFDLFEKERKFILSNYKTTDGYIEKYPPRRNDAKISPIGLYYYSFRDFNSLKRNTSFINKRVPNAIVVTIENFYKYSYLYTLKKLFRPEDAWLYGNISPLMLGDIERDKGLYVSYVLKTHNVIKNMKKSTYKKLLEYYDINNINKIENLDKLETEISNKLRSEFERQAMQASKGAIHISSSNSTVPASQPRMIKGRQSSLGKQLQIPFIEH